MNTGVVITGIGMVTSVGYNAVQTCASIRAGINRFQEPEYYFFCQTNDPESDEPDPLVCAPVYTLDINTDWQERILLMMLSSMKDLINNSGLLRTNLQEAAFFLAVPSEEREGFANNFKETILPDFYKRSAISPFTTAKLFFKGHAACYIALQEAIASLKKGLVKYCIIGGVDSYFDYDTLEGLDQANRLKSDRNRDSFLPGEAGSFFLIELKETAKKRNQPPLATIKGASTSFEKNGFYSESPCLAKGLTKSITEALGDPGDKPSIEWAVCDLNGESFRSQEWAIAYTRLGKIFPHFDYMHHPADCLGDIGAASGPLNIALAARAFQHNYAPAETALIWGSSDEGERGATILTRYKDEN